MVFYSISGSVRRAVADVYIWLFGFLGNMQIDVFTEGANTKEEDPERDVFREYFGGTFRSARTFIEELDEQGSVDMHILSDDFGYVRGSDRSDTAVEGDVDRDGAVQEFTSQLLASARDADVFAVLLSKDTFRDVVVSHWDELVSRANPDAIWCLSSSEKVLNEVEMERQLTPSVIAYHRSGVARIGIDARSALIELIEQKREGVGHGGRESFQEFGREESVYKMLQSES